MSQKATCKNSRCQNQVMISAAVGEGYCSQDCQFLGRKDRHDIAALRKHQCPSCAKDDDEWIYLNGWNDALSAVEKVTPRDTRDEVIAQLEAMAERACDSYSEMYDVHAHCRGCGFHKLRHDAKEALALLRAPETQDGPSRDFLLAENARLKAALKERGETQERETCPQCGGDGAEVTTGMGHNCDGTDIDCARSCPVQTQDIGPCQTCGGDGFLVPSPPAQTEDRA